MKNSKNILLGAVLLTASSPWLHQLLRTIIGALISAMIDGNFIRTGVS